MLGAFWVSPVSANKWHLTASDGLQEFNFQEFKENGERLLSEKGSLPLINFSLQYSQPKYYLSSRLNYGIGTVAYDGQTQGGTPLTTKTKIELGSLYGELGWNINSNIAVFAGLSTHFLDRNVLATATTASFFTRYTWDQLGIGTRYSTKIKPLQSINGHVLLSKTYNPNASATSPADGFKDVGLELGSKNHIELGVNWIYKIPEKYSLGIGAQYNRYKFGASNTIPTGTGQTIREPRSKTSLLSFNVFLVYSF